MGVVCLFLIVFFFRYPSERQNLSKERDRERYSEPPNPIPVSAVVAFLHRFTRDNQNNNNEYLSYFNLTSVILPTPLSRFHFSGKLVYHTKRVKTDRMVIFRGVQATTQHPGTIQILGDYTRKLILLFANINCYQTGNVFKASSILYTLLQRRPHQQKRRTVEGNRDREKRAIPPLMVIQRSSSNF